MAWGPREPSFHDYNQYIVVVDVNTGEKYDVPEIEKHPYICETGRNIHV